MLRNNPELNVASERDYKVLPTKFWLRSDFFDGFLRKNESQPFSEILNFLIFQTYVLEARSENNSYCAEVFSIGIFGDETSEENNFCLL